MRVRFALALGITILGLSACGPYKGLPPVVRASQVPAPSAIPTATALTRPPVRAGAALAFDPHSGQLLLIGGMPDPLDPQQRGSSVGRDFWAWTPGSGWRQLTPAIVPTVGYMSGMAYDARAGVTVLVSVGGQTVWTWDGKSWSAANGGLQMDEIGGVAYDSKAEAVRVVGRELSATAQAETMWTWNGSTWSSAPTPMGLRTEVGVAYDTSRNNLVVYGGGDPATWLYDGTKWTSVTNAAAPSFIQANPAAAFDERNGQVVLYTVGGETWTWDGSNWKIRASGGGPGIRRDESLAYDPAIGKVVLFGGKLPGGQDEVYMNDLWAWDGTRWSALA